jgi:hypothetical protein
LEEDYLVSSVCLVVLFELCLLVVGEEHVQLELELDAEEDSQLQVSIPYAAF